jgi:Short C-terminal domain
MPFGRARRVARRTSRRTARRQMGMYGDQGGGEAYSAAPAAPDPLDQLERFAKLHQAGALTDEEFAAQKAKLLG